MSGFALAQRRHEDREDVEAVVEILAERAGRDRLLQSLLVAAISRTLTLMVSVPPSRSNSRSCSTRSSLTCVARLMSPISSRNSVPPSASSKRPFFRASRAGERALLVAEQLRLDQAVGQRRAADLDERLLRAQRVVVDRVRDQLLAGARLAANQHGGVGARDLRDLLVDLPHRAAGADDVREVVALAQLLPQVRVLVDQALLVLLDQPLDLDRLRDHRRDDAEELDAALEVALRLELEIDAERADGSAVEQDRHADEAELLVAPARAASPRDCRNAGSRLTRGTTIGLPLSTTLPVMPSPSAVADRARAVAEAVGRLDAQLAVVVEQRRRCRGPRRDAAPRISRTRCSDALRFERAGQRLAHFEQRREPARFTRWGIDSGGRGQRAGAPRG